METDREQSDWRERLNFFSAVFGIAGGVALIASILLWFSGHSTLLQYSGFACLLFLFLWMLDYALRSSNRSVVSLGNLTPDGWKPLKEETAVIEKSVAIPCPDPHTRQVKQLSA